MKKIDAISKIISTTPELYTNMLSLVEPKDRHLVLLKAFEHLHHEDQQETIARLLKLLTVYSPELTKRVIESEPFLFTYLEETQTEELCNVVINAAHKKDPTKLSFLFRFVRYQNEQLVHTCVSSDPRCYKYVQEWLKSYDLAIEAVQKDGLILKDVEPEYQNRGLLKTAIDQNPYAVKYIKTEDMHLLEEMQIYAIEKDLGAIPKMGSHCILPKTIKKYKELCIQKSYYNPDWVEILNFTQEELYNMLRNIQDQGKAYLIYKELNSEFSTKALEEGLIEDSSLTVKDLIDLGENAERISKILQRCSGETITNYFAVVSEQEGNTKIEEILAYNGELLKHIPKDIQTISMCLKAVSNTESAIVHVLKWDNALFDKLSKYVNQL